MGFVKVDRWYPSSQICSNCGTVHREMKDLSIRTVKCDCGLVMDRDHNAALNIKEEGLRILKKSAAQPLNNNGRPGTGRT